MRLSSIIYIIYILWDEIKLIILNLLNIMGHMDATMGWIFLLLASAIEPIWPTALEKSENFKNLKWGVVAVVLVMLCLYLLSLAVAALGPGLSYSILAGIGAVGVVLIGYVFYKGKLTVRRILFISMIIVGVIGIRLASGGMI